MNKINKIKRYWLKNNMNQEECEPFPFLNNDDLVDISKQEENESDLTRELCEEWKCDLSDLFFYCEREAQALNDARELESLQVARPWAINYKNGICFSDTCIDEIKEKGLDVNNFIFIDEFSSKQELIDTLNKVNCQTSVFKKILNTVIFY